MASLLLEEKVFLHDFVKKCEEIRTSDWDTTIFEWFPLEIPVFIKNRTWGLRLQTAWLYSNNTVVIENPGKDTFVIPGDGKHALTKSTSGVIKELSSDDLQQCLEENALLIQDVKKPKPNTPQFVAKAKDLPLVLAHSYSLCTAEAVLLLSNWTIQYWAPPLFDLGIILDAANGRIYIMEGPNYIIYVQLSCALQHGLPGEIVQTLQSCIEMVSPLFQ